MYIFESWNIFIFPSSILSLKNILIRSREIKTKETYEKMNSMVSQIKFAFGNEISNFVIMNMQRNNIIFKAFLFPNNEVPLYVKKKSKELLESFQTQLKKVKNSYFTDAASKNQIKKNI